MCIQCYAYDCSLSPIFKEQSLKKHIQRDQLKMATRISKSIRDTKHFKWDLKIIYPNVVKSPPFFNKETQLRVV